MFERALPLILKYEGGYVNNPNDSGGATNKGITQRVYDAYLRRKNLPKQSVKAIHPHEVAAIYEQNYWRDGQCHIIADTHKHVAVFHFDTAVNCGIRQAAVLLQRAVGAKDDGIIGPRTLALVDSRTEDDIIERYAEERCRFYRRLVRNRRKDREFFLGWLVRVARLEATLYEWSTRNS